MRLRDCKHIKEVDSIQNWCTYHQQLLAGSTCDQCPDYEKKKCKHEWEQIGKEYYVSEEDNMIGKKCIDQCKKCGKRRDR